MNGLCDSKHLTFSLPFIDDSWWNSVIQKWIYENIWNKNVHSDCKISIYPSCQWKQKKKQQQQQIYPMQTHTIMRLWNDITLSEKEYQLYTEIHTLHKDYTFIRYISYKILWTWSIWLQADKKNTYMRNAFSKDLRFLISIHV